ncbi:hypothetical protein F4778DRAFT_176055 [Xylariomycetidae sp. FL2044]|nr:hypothetical protein F4778DRAFT_176055 [Xylariomycetidae sp. FL2044]
MLFFFAIYGGDLMGNRMEFTVSFGSLLLRRRGGTGRNSSILTAYGVSGVVWYGMVWVLGTIPARQLVSGVYISHDDSTCDMILFRIYWIIGCFACSFIRETEKGREMKTGESCDICQSVCPFEGEASH